MNDVQVLLDRGALRTGGACGQDEQRRDQHREPAQAERALLVLLSARGPRHGSTRGQHAGGVLYRTFKKTLSIFYTLFCWL